jgi:hypothetical protein
MSDPIERLVGAIEALPAAFDNDGVRALLAAQDLLNARVATAVDGVDPYADGALTTASWLHTQTGRSRREAGALVKRAARVGACPELGTAWRDGRLSIGQVEAVVVNVSTRTEAIFAEQAGDLLPTLADLSVRDTERAMQQWAASAEALVNTPEPCGSERTVFLSAGVDGWGELTGRLDPAGYLVVDAALDAATVLDRSEEMSRTRNQRRADALVAVARHFLDHADVAATTRGSRPEVHVVVTVADLEQAVGRSLDGDALDPVAIGSLLCDAGLHRVVTDGRSVVLDVGRTTRTVSHHLLSALAVRDGGCRFPGCDRPVSWCEAHHVMPWQHGGETAPSNLVLLCWRHHHDFAHHPQWHLKLLPDATVEVTKPDGTTLSSRPPAAVSRRWPSPAAAERSSAGASPGSWTHPP